MHASVSIVIAEIGSCVESHHCLEKSCIIFYIVNVECRMDNKNKPSKTPFFEIKCIDIFIQNHLIQNRSMNEMVPIGIAK